MKADIEIDDVDLHGNADSKGTIGKLNANITWTSDGIQETIQDSLPFIGGLVNSVTTDPSAGTIELTGAMGLGASPSSRRSPTASSRCRSTRSTRSASSSRTRPRRQR